MTYGDFKDLARRTVSDKVLKDKAFDIAKIQNMICIKEALLLWFIIFQIKNYLSFKDNVWVTDLADMQLISKLNTGTRFLLCIIEHGLLL